MEFRPVVLGSGGDEGDRTPDLSIANAALSHLSYIPTKTTAGTPSTDGMKR